MTPAVKIPAQPLSTPPTAARPVAEMRLARVSHAPVGHPWRAGACKMDASNAGVRVRLRTMQETPIKMEV